MIDLRLGRYQEILHDVVCDALISDPPYGKQAHEGHDSQRQYDAAERRMLAYSSLSPEDVNAFVDFWHPRTRGWMAVMSCSNLFPVWRAAFNRVGRYSFAPLPCVMRGMTVRLRGDGPSSWAVYLNVARPKTEEFASWGTLPGAYPTTRKSQGHIGGKPISWMTAIVGDYSRVGDIVCDPCAGFATTAVACKALGRHFVGAEVDPDTFATATERIEGGTQTEMFGGSL